jgi:hypothetical protein
MITVQQLRETLQHFADPQLILVAAFHVGTPQADVYEVESAENNSGHVQLSITLDRRVKRH